MECQSFGSICADGARRFLQTAIVIDDRAFIDSAASDDGGAKPRTATMRAPVRVGPPESKSVQDGQESLIATASHAFTDGEGAGPAGDLSLVDDASKLDAVAITDAFMAAEVICGVHKPAGPHMSLEVALRAAAHADIIVLDWYLEKGSSAKAKEVIVRTLAADQLEHGRIRLIAVYTSEPGRIGVASDIFKAVEVVPELAGTLVLDEVNAMLVARDTRICVFNKEGTVSGSDVFRVPASDLPAKLIEQFGLLTNGLLANFAVNAVASVRRGAHHVLSRFSRQLDGAYLSHRAGIEDPDSALEFAVDLISVELKSVIENSGLAASTLGIQAVEAWVDDRSRSGEFKTEKAIIPAELMKEILRIGLSRLKDKNGQLSATTAGKEPDDPVSAKSILRVFYPDVDAARAAAKDFSRLTSFKREVKRVRLENFFPLLTLGAVLKARSDLSPANSFDEVSAQYLICVQPRCDSVRLASARSFPFLPAEYSEKSFNLIVDEPDHVCYQAVDVKACNTLMFRFAPPSGVDSIVATRVGTEFHFVDDRGRVFEWVADLVDLKAQRFASELAANVHRVGIDEFEWLRLGSGSIKPEAPTRKAAEVAQGAPAVKAAS